MQYNLMRRETKVSLALIAVLTLGLRPASAQKKEVVWSADEKPLANQIHGLRALADDIRAETTKDLALKIRKLPATENKLRLAVNLAGLSTEGDFGHDTLQEVATTLAETLRERPVPWAKPAEKNEFRRGRERRRHRVRRRIHILNSPRWCATNMSRCCSTLIMTSSFGRQWPGWRRMTASGSIRSLR